jgi:hypothetical protein
MRLERLASRFRSMRPAASWQRGGEVARDRAVLPATELAAADRSGCVDRSRLSSSLTAWAGGCMACSGGWRSLPSSGVCCSSPARGPLGRRREPARAARACEAAQQPPLRARSRSVRTPRIRPSCPRPVRTGASRRRRRARAVGTLHLGGGALATAAEAVHRRRPIGGPRSRLTGLALPAWPRAPSHPESEIWAPTSRDAAQRARRPGTLGVASGRRPSPRTDNAHCAAFAAIGRLDRRGARSV